jgi:hypothetical protein
MPNRLAVFVPVSAATPIATIVARGSAIIGEACSDGSEGVTVDYEGALNGQANIKTYADRARHAFGRQITRYPTVARCVVPRSELRQVGWFDPESGIALFDDAHEAVASWLGVAAIDPQELHFSGPVSRLPGSLTGELP